MACEKFIPPMSDQRYTLFFLMGVDWTAVRIVIERERLIDDPVMVSISITIVFSHAATLAYVQ